LRKTPARDAQEGEIEIQFGTGVKKVKAAGKEGGFVPTIPAVTHEIGQYNVYPDYREMEGYTGVLEARNFEIFRERLEKAGMGEQAEDFIKWSWRQPCDPLIWQASRFWICRISLDRERRLWGC